MNKLPSRTLFHFCCHSDKTGTGSDIVHDILLLWWGSMWNNACGQRTLLTTAGVTTPHTFYINLPPTHSMVWAISHFSQGLDQQQHGVAAAWAFRWWKTGSSRARPSGTVWWWWFSVACSFLLMTVELCVIHPSSTYPPTLLYSLLSCLIYAL